MKYLKKVCDIKINRHEYKLSSENYQRGIEIIFEDKEFSGVTGVPFAEGNREWWEITAEINEEIKRIEKSYEPIVAIHYEQESSCAHGVKLYESCFSCTLEMGSRACAHHDNKGECPTCRLKENRSYCTHGILTVRHCDKCEEMIKTLLELDNKYCNCEELQKTRKFADDLFRSLGISQFFIRNDICPECQKPIKIDK